MMMMALTGKLYYTKIICNLMVRDKYIYNNIYMYIRILVYSRYRGNYVTSGAWYSVRSKIEVLYFCVQSSRHIHVCIISQQLVGFHPLVNHVHSACYSWDEDQHLLLLFHFFFHEQTMPLKWAVHKTITLLYEFFLCVWHSKFFFFECFIECVFGHTKWLIVILFH